MDVTSVPYVLAGQALAFDWWVRPICEGRKLAASHARTESVRATLLLQFNVVPACNTLIGMLDAISSNIELVDHRAGSQLTVVSVPDPVPASMVNALAQLPELRWLEPDCGCFVAAQAGL
jgi:hypothetical protein